MAPKQRSQKPPNSEKNVKPSPVSKYKLILNYDYMRRFIFDPTKLLPALCLLFLTEIIINVYVIQRVKYTEIDWKAYMQEVEGPLNGTYNYSLLKGDTGPLVYPAGFVWIFSGFYAVTNRGENIRLAQYLFLVVYLANLALVFRIYLRAKKVPPYVLILTCLTSYRIHSIYVLRLFNDPIAMLLLFGAINAFLDSRWSLGSLLYSLAVSVKMNVLLFAPALLLTYLTNLGLKRTIVQLCICAAVQFLLAIPFLIADPVAYLMGAFDFGRVFLHQWTVNWRFLPEIIFVNKLFHLTLLVVHIGLLALFYKYSKVSLESYARLKSVETDIKDQFKKDTNFNMNTVSQLFLTPIFLSNLVGVACSRSLHYQFYVWYFNTLPYLAWSTHYSTSIRLIILGVIEFCWNTYPSTIISSILLHCCHAALIWGIYRTQIQTSQTILAQKLQTAAKIQ